MRVNHWNRSRHIAELAAVVVLILAFLSWSRHVSSNAQSATTGLSDVGSQMVEYTKQGRYEDAIQTGLRSLQNQPGDEIIYEGIATVYLVRAGKDSERRSQWVEQAVSYTEKAMALNSRDRDAAGVHLLQDARSFEVAGDLSVLPKCKYYERARTILESRVPLLQADQLTLEGRAFPLAPLRKENEKRLSEVKAKAANADCK